MGEVSFTSTQFTESVWLLLHFGLLWLGSNTTVAVAVNERVVAIASTAATACGCCGFGNAYCDAIHVDSVI